MTNKAKIQKSAQVTCNTIHNKCIGQIPGDNRGEFWTVLDPLDLYFSLSAKTYNFDQLPRNVFIAILQLLLTEPAEVRKTLKHQYPNIKDRLKRYAICLFGANDGTADWENGKLSPSENFRCKPGIQCECLKYRNKAITVNGHELTFKEIELMDEFATGEPDKATASKLLKSLSTLDTQKTNLLRKTGTQSKLEFVVTAISQHAINIIPS